MSFEELDLSNESNLHQVTPDNVNQKPPRLLLIVLNGIAALLCTVAAILSLMGEDGASIEVASVRIVNLALLVGVAAFACLLVSFIAQKRKWRPSGASSVKAGALVFLFLLLCLIFVFRYPAFLTVTWTSASAVDEGVHYQYLSFSLTMVAATLCEATVPGTLRSSVRAGVSVLSWKAAATPLANHLARHVT